MTRLPDFRLETYFSRWEFTARHHLTASDVQTMPMAELLALAGVSAADHDLARVLGQGQVEKRFADTDVIQLTPGARFVSIFTGSTPVV